MDMRRGAPDTDLAPPGRGARVGLLDGFRLLVDGEPVDLPPATQRLVALIALRRRPAQRTSLAGSLWPEATEHEALARLRSALWRLRQRCCVTVEAGSGHVQLLAGTTVDVHELECRAQRLLDPAAPLLPGDDDPAWLRAELLPEWWEEWVVVERERLRQLRLHALEVVAERLTAREEFARAIDVALAAVAVEPLRETPHRLLIRIHLAEGNRSEALRVYDAYRDALTVELGVAPSPRMHDLVASLHV